MMRIVLLLAGLVVAIGCSPRPDPDNSKAEAIKANLDQLSPEDRALADKQKVCAKTEEPLGSMGVPIKVMVKGEPVFVCCKGCEASVAADPDKTLAKVKALKEKNTP